VDKWGASSTVRLIFGLLKNCPKGEEKLRLQEFLKVSRVVEDSLVVSSKSDLHMVFGDKFTKSRNRPDGSKKLNLTGDTVVRFNFGSHLSNLTLETLSRRSGGRLKEVNRIYELICKSAQVKEENLRCSYRHKKNQKHELTLEVPSSNLILLEPAILLVTSGRPSSALCQKALLTSLTFCSLIDFSTFLTNCMRIPVEEEDDWDDGSSVSSVISSQDSEEEGDDSDEDRFVYYRTAAQLSITLPLLTEPMIRSMTNLKTRNRESLEEHKNAWYAFIQDNIVPEGQVETLATKLESDFPGWYARNAVVTDLSQLPEAEEVVEEEKADGDATALTEGAWSVMDQEDFWSSDDEMEW
jgi:hypothetical protein